MQAKFCATGFERSPSRMSAARIRGCYSGGHGGEAMRRGVWALLAAGWVAGCASSGVQVSPDQVAAIRKGVSTEADVRAALGAPTGVSTVNGQRILVYSGGSYQARPESFIPIVGAFVGGADVRAAYVAITFDSAGRVADVIAHHQTSGTATGMAAPPIAPVANQPR